MGTITTNNRWKKREELRHVQFHPGDNLGDLVNSQGYLPLEVDLMVALINGEVVDDWKGHTLKQEDHISVMLLPHGGGDDDGGSKQVIGAIAMIAVAVVAPYIAAGIAGAGTFGATVIAGAIDVGASMMISAIQKDMYKPPAQPAVETGSAFMAVSSGQNTISPYGVVPTVFGKMRMYPNLVTQAELETVGDHQTIIQSFDFGFGNVELTEEKFGDTLIGTTGALIRRVLHDNFDSTSGLEMNYRIVTNKSLSDTLKDAGDTSIFTTPLNTKEILVEMALPSGLVGYHDDGTKVSAEFDLKVEISTVGGTFEPAFQTTGLVDSFWFADENKFLSTTTTDNLHVSGKSIQGTRVGFNFLVKVPGEYIIRITRITADTTKDKKQTTSNVDFVRTALSGGHPVIQLLDNTVHTIVELKVKGTKLHNGRLDNYSAVAHSKVWVFDGATWIKKTSSNPAWLCLYALYIGANRKRLDIFDAAGNPDTAKVRSKVNLDTLLDWAQWCDREGFECNMVNTSVTTVKELLSTIASCGLAIPVSDDGRIGFIYEAKPKAVTQLVTSKNSTGMSASMSYQSTIMGLRVKFVNQELNYDQDEIIVNRDSSLVTPENTPVRQSDYEVIELPGTTTVAQATLLGRFYIAQRIFRRERVSFSMDVENLAMQRGDTITVASDIMKEGGQPLKIANIHSDSVNDYFVVDEEIIGVGTPLIRDRAGILHPVSAFSGKTIIAPVGTITSLHIGGVIIAGEASTIETNYTVEDIRAGKDLTANITAVEGAETLYDMITSGAGIPVREPKLGYNDHGLINAVSVNAFVDNVIIERQRLFRITLIWSNAHAAISYYLIRDGDGETIGTSETNSFNVEPIADATLTHNELRKFTITPVGLNGNYGSETEITVTLIKDITPPNDIVEFSSNVQNEHTLLNWRALDQDDVVGFEIRYSSSTTAPVWANSIIVSQELPWGTSDLTVPSRIGTYMIKAFDSSGNFSENALTTTTLIQQLDYNHNFETLDPGATAWPDIASSANIKQYDPTSISLTDGAYRGTYQVVAPYDIGQVETVRLSVDMFLSVIVQGEHLSDPWFGTGNPADLPTHTAGIEAADPLSPGLLRDANLGDAQIYISISDTDVAADYTPYKRLVAGDYKFRFIKYQVRLYSKDGSATPRVQNANLRLDYKQRTERQSNVRIGAGGQTIGFTNGFSMQPTIAITLQDADLGDHFKISLVTFENFLIEGFDAANNPKEINVDIVAVGHGKRD